MKRTLTDEIKLTIDAGTPLIVVQTIDPEELELALQKLCESNNYPLKICRAGAPQPEFYENDLPEQANKLPAMQKLRIGAEFQKTIPDLIDACKELNGTALDGRNEPIDAGPPFDSMVILYRNAHVDLKEPQGAVKRMALRLQELYRALPPIGIHVVLQVPLGFEVPDELQHYVKTITQELPDHARRRFVLATTMEALDRKATAADLEAAALATSGLSGLQIEQLASYSVAAKGRLDVPLLAGEKIKTINRSAALKVLSTPLEFDQLGGVTGLKDFTLPILERIRDGKTERTARGLIIFGVPGTGKSLFAKTLGKRVDRLTLQLDIGALYGSLMGQSERQWREAKAIVEACAPCILFVDELEKALGGSSADTHETSNHIRQDMLSWLNDKTADVYVVATANDVSNIPPELLRSGRFDAKFFMDVPGEEQREEIWKIWLEHYGIDTEQDFPVDADWTGADIESCCNLAELRGCTLKEAGKYVVPVLRGYAQQIAKIRAFADNSCIDAQTGEPFELAKTKSRVSATPAARKRRVRTAAGV